MNKEHKPPRVVGVFNPLNNVTFEVRLVSLYKEPGTGNVQEGVVWRFALTPSQIEDLAVVYTL